MSFAPTSKIPPSNAIPTCKQAAGPPPQPLSTSHLLQVPSVEDLYGKLSKVAFRKENAKLLITTEKRSPQNIF
eukprot:gene1924-5013_t